MYDILFFSISAISFYLFIENLVYFFIKMKK